MAEEVLLSVNLDMGPAEETRRQWERAQAARGGGGRAAQIAGFQARRRQRREAQERIQQATVERLSERQKQRRRQQQAAVQRATRTKKAPEEAAAVPTGGAVDVYRRALAQRRRIAQQRAKGEEPEAKPGGIASARRAQAIRARVAGARQKAADAQQREHDRLLSEREKAEAKKNAKLLAQKLDRLAIFAALQTSLSVDLNSITRTVAETSANTLRSVGGLAAMKGKTGISALLVGLSAAIKATLALAREGESDVFKTARYNPKVAAAFAQTRMAEFAFELNVSNRRAVQASALGALAAERQKLASEEMRGATAAKRRVTTGFKSYFESGETALAPLITNMVNVMEAGVVILGAMWDWLKGGGMKGKLDDFDPLNPRGPARVNKEMMERFEKEKQQNAGRGAEDVVLGRPDWDVPFGMDSPGKEPDYARAAFA